jgi:phosphohistidine phosphatase
VLDSLCEAVLVTEHVATRHLIIVRHAKAAWPDVEDRQRPLAERGRRDAPAAGRWLRAAERRNAELRIDRVVCSPARRTRETWELAAAELDDPPPPVYDGRVYAATTSALLTVLRETPAHVRCLVLVGHNPGMQNLALALARDDSGDPLGHVREKYPTSGIAVFTVEGEWSELKPGEELLTEFAIPRGDGSEAGD